MAYLERGRVEELDGVGFKYFWVLKRQSEEAYGDTGDGERWRRHGFLGSMAFVLGFLCCLILKSKERREQSVCRERSKKKI